MGVPAEFIFFLAHLIRVEWKSLSGNWQIPPHTHPTILLSHFLQNLKRPPSKLIGVTWTWNKPTRMSILNKCLLLQGSPFESLISSSNEPIIPPSICNSPPGQASLRFCFHTSTFISSDHSQFDHLLCFLHLVISKNQRPSWKDGGFSLHDNVQEHIPHNPKTIPYCVLSSGIISKWQNIFYRRSLLKGLTLVEYPETLIFKNHLSCMTITFSLFFLSPGML